MLRNMVRLSIHLLILIFCSGILASRPSVSEAAPAISCHCFQDRQFSPDQPQAFDPYLLATVQNRLLAHAFGVQRKEIVRFKMNGVGNDRLWIACRIARASGRDIGEILELNDKVKSWPALIEQLGLDPEALESTFLAALIQNVGEMEPAWQLIAEILIRNFEISALELSHLLQAGATRQEVILDVVLAATLKRSAPMLLTEQRQAGSWGALLAQYGVILDQLSAQITRQIGSDQR
jgi:hypothetical protein